MRDRSRTRQNPTFAYQPALDGVRALAIVLVILFHLGYDWIPGGYLGVSVFFTLSGYLITSLVIDEIARTKHVPHARSFYARRVRRLMPASLMCIAAVALLVAAGILQATRADILGSLFQVSNWQQLVADQSYADLFRSPSPVAHFWSLAIEEQFYWVWPVAMAGIATLAARLHHRSVLRLLIGAYTLFSASAVLTAQFLSPDAVYFASWSRFAEILAGAALAAAIARRSVPRAAALLAPICLAAIVVLAVVTPAGRGWAYQGGLPLFALLTVGLIVGLQPASPVRNVLSRGPIVWTGRVSYELYLFHWPVFLVMTEQRMGLHGFTLTLARLGVTVAISALVFHAVDLPVRTRRILARTRPMFASTAAGVFALLVAVALIVPASLPSRGPRPNVLAATQLAPVATATPSGGASATGDTAPSPPPAPKSTTVAIFGDSVPDWLLRDAATSYVRTDITIVNGAHEACDGAVDLPLARDRNGVKLYPPDDCQQWPASYPAVAEDPLHPVDIAVLMIGQGPYVDHLIGDEWTGPCDTMGWYTSDVAARIAYLRHHVGEVVLAIPSWSGDLVTYIVPEDYRARMACIRTALTAVAMTTRVPIVDLAALLCPSGPDGECAPYTSDDGVHVNPPEAPMVLNWLLDSLPTAAARPTVN